MEALIVFIVFGSFAGVTLGFRWMRHRERMAELEVERQRALPPGTEALPPDRASLARELLAAYDETNS
jgi:hypothetical protein